ncbi:MAG: c-type cytochrome domain-containing protein, partial [Deltaproteobacteria bacterium]
MKRFFYSIGVAAAMAVLAGREARVMAQAQADPHRALVTTYCVGCHSTRLKTGGLALEGLSLQTPADNADVWEKVLRKLRGRQMPPPG